MKQNGHTVQNKLRNIALVDHKLLQAINSAKCFLDSPANIPPLPTLPLLITVMQCLQCMLEFQECKPKREKCSKQTVIAPS